MQENTIRSETVFAGKLLRLEVVDVELEDGTRSVREVVRHPGAAAVIARVGHDRYLFVRQYRKPVEQVMVEVIAGTLDNADESPEDCARREVEEETGHHVDSLERLGVIYPSPGYVDERIDVFRADLSRGNTDRSADLDERIDPVELTREAIIHMIRSGEITDAKTLAVWTLHESATESESPG